MVGLEMFLPVINEFETLIQYKFKKKEYLLLGLTHSSYANEKRPVSVKSNERLEFLGDAVLNIIVSEYIYNNFPDISEGRLTKLRASVVCEPSLVKCAENLNLGKYVFLGKGEEITGGRKRTSILSDTFEAVIGAIYIDGGMKNSKKFILNHLKQLINDSADGMFFMDFKTQLQEVIQKKSDNRISYEIVDEQGPDHNKLFISQVKVAGRVLGRGEGKTKKEAEQNAARKALNSQQ